MKTDNQELIKVGLVLEGHGLRGDLYVMIFSGDVSWTDDLDQLHLLPAGEVDLKKIKAYEIEKIKPFKKGFIVKLEGINNRNQSDELKKYEVWVNEDLFISEDGEQPYLTELLGFAVQDSKLGLIGKIEGFSTNGIQDLLIMDKKINDQNVEIPFIKEFVVNIDYDKQNMMMDLPEGLIEINEKD